MRELARLLRLQSQDGAHDQRPVALISGGNFSVHQCI